eukprot:1183604-Prorocentrum_minimum.AAC.1
MRRDRIHKDYQSSGGNLLLPPPRSAWLCGTLNALGRYISVAASQGTLAPSQGTLAPSQGTLALSQGTLAPSQGTLANRAK